MVVFMETDEFRHLMLSNISDLRSEVKAVGLVVSGTRTDIANLQTSVGRLDERTVALSSRIDRLPPNGPQSAVNRGAMMVAAWVVLVAIAGLSAIATWVR